MAVRWIGSKARVVQDILTVVGAPTADSRVFVDAFAGTGVVAAAAARKGWALRINDHLLCATVATAARLTSRSGAPFSRFGGYERALNRLQEAPSRLGFVWREYSPASVGHGEHKRMYFTESNAAKIDGIRSRIDEWAAQELITDVEVRLLLADLLTAVNAVANIAGTYGCFLSRWSASACRPLQLMPRELATERSVLEVFNVDVKDVPSAHSDTVYLDPPYTKRQYAAYYHIQETVAHGDEPEVAGVTGLRPWREKASDYCYKTRALDALDDLVRTLDARRIFLSYSSEGHVALADLRPRLERLGAVKVHDLGDVGRYRPNRAAVDTGASVNEYLIELVKTPTRDLDGDLALA